MADTPDRVGILLRELATQVQASVDPPDPSDITGLTFRKARPRRRPLLIAALAITITAVLLTIGLSGAHGRGSSIASTADISFGQHTFVIRDLDASTAPVRSINHSAVASIRLPIVSSNHASMAFGDGYVWVIEQQAVSPLSSCGNLARIDPNSLLVALSPSIPLCPDAVAYGNGSVWVLAFQIGVEGYQLERFDPVTLQMESTVTIDSGPKGVTQQGDTEAKYFFLTIQGNDLIAAVEGQRARLQLVVVDLRSDSVMHSVLLPIAIGQATALSSKAGVVWVGTNRGWVLKIDPLSGMILRKRHLAAEINDLSATTGAVWAGVSLPVPRNANYPGLDIVRLSTKTEEITKDTGLPMVWVAADAGAVWALGSAVSWYRTDAGLVARINSSSGKLVGHVDLTKSPDRAPNTIGVQNGQVWIENGLTGSLTRIIGPSR